MSFRDLIARVEGSRRTLTLFNVEAPRRALDQLHGFLDPLHVRVRERETPEGRPTNFAVLHDGPEYVAASSLADVYRRVDPETGIHRRSELADVDYPEVLQAIPSATFTEFGKRRMTIVSREIETAAWDRDAGQLHVGFQRLSLLEHQRGIYEKLADSGVETHVYGSPDRSYPDLDVEVHGSETAELTDFWFAVFDGDGDDAEKRALLAEEVGDDVYSGFWTYRADVADEVFAHLTETHLDRSR